MLRGLDEHLREGKHQGMVDLASRQSIAGACAGLPGGGFRLRDKREAPGVGPCSSHISSWREEPGEVSDRSGEDPRRGAAPRLRRPLPPRRGPPAVPPSPTTPGPEGFSSLLPFRFRLTGGARWPAPRSGSPTCQEDPETTPRIFRPEGRPPGTLHPVHQPPGQPPPAPPGPEGWPVPSAPGRRSTTPRRPGSRWPAWPTPQPALWEGGGGGHGRSPLTTTSPHGGEHDPPGYGTHGPCGGWQALPLVRLRGGRLAAPGVQQAPRRTRWRPRLCRNFSVRRMGWRGGGRSGSGGGAHVRPPRKVWSRGAGPDQVSSRSTIPGPGQAGSPSVATAAAPAATPVRRARDQSSPRTPAPPPARPSCCRRPPHGSGGRTGGGSTRSRKPSDPPPRVLPRPPGERTRRRAPAPPPPHSGPPPPGPLSVSRVRPATSPSSRALGFRSSTPPPAPPPGRPPRLSSATWMPCSAATAATLPQKSSGTPGGKASTSHDPQRRRIHTRYLF